MTTIIDATYQKGSQVLPILSGGQTPQQSVASLSSGLSGVVDMDTIRYLNNNVHESIINLPTVFVDPDPIKTRTQTNNFLVGMLQAWSSKPEDQRRTEMFKLLYYDPTNFYLYYLIAFSFKIENLLDQARSFFRLSLIHNHNHIDSYLELSILYHKIDNYFAIKLLEKASSIDPNDKRVTNTLAIFYADNNRYEDAERLLKPLTIDEKIPLDVRVKGLINLGVIVSSMGQNERSIKYLDLAEKLALKADLGSLRDKARMGILQNKLLILNNIHTSDQQPDQEQKQETETGPKIIQFDLQGQKIEFDRAEIEDQYDYLHSYSDKYEYVLNEHLKINTVFTGYKRFYETDLDLNRAREIIKERRSHRPNNKIKIGYVSYDLRNHVVSKFIHNILKDHDRSKFEVYCFYTYKIHDQITVKLKALNMHWFDVCAMNDLEIATLIKKEEIDILVDLNGHTDGNRLGIFAHKPAPIQITYLGYPNTSGLKEIDYRITDSIADHPETKQLYSEKLLRLKKSFITYHPMICSVQNTSFFDIELDWKKPVDEPIIFGAINRPAKNNPELLKTWARLLQEVPQSKFLIKVKSICDQQDVIEFYLKELNLTKDRLIFVEYMKSNDDYFRLFNKVDILLDTFPYSGTTTTCDALYMSVPVITLYNKNCHSQNVSASILTNIELPEFIAKTTDEYINIAKALADPYKVYEYRKIIRARFINYMASDVFIKDYENTLESIL